jgi:hypothetical protein
MFADLDLWRNISAGRFIAPCSARESGQLRVYVLVVLHALSLNPAVNTAVAINDVVFDDLTACRSRKRSYNGSLTMSRLAARAQPAWRWLGDIGRA